MVENYRTIAVAALSAAVVVFGAFWLFGPEDGVNGKNGRDGTFGALAGPDIPSNYLQWGGLYTFQGAEDMQTATTTLCAIQAPPATSTLSFAGWTITGATGTAATIDIGIGRTAFATSTTLVTGTSVAANALGEAAWSDVTGTTGIMRPNDWLIVKTAGPGLGGYTYTGHCVAQFHTL